MRVEHEERIWRLEEKLEIVFVSSSIGIVVFLGFPHLQTILTKVFIINNVRILYTFSTNGYKSMEKLENERTKRCDVMYKCSGGRKKDQRKKKRFI